MPRTIDLSGKRALVTGSTTGIGEATARCLAEAGVAVMISGRNPQRGEEPPAELVDVFFAGLVAECDTQWVLGIVGPLRRGQDVGEGLADVIHVRRSVATDV